MPTRRGHASPHRPAAESRRPRPAAVRQRTGLSALIVLLALPLGCESTPTASNDQTLRDDDCRAQLASITAERDALADQLAAQRRTYPPLPDEVAAAFNAFAAQNPEQAWFDDQRGVLVLSSSELFHDDSARLRQEARPLLATLAPLIAAATSAANRYDALIAVHASDAPIVQPHIAARYPTRWRLSAHQGLAVKDALVSAGAPEAFLGVLAYSHLRPIARARDVNARVEILLAPRPKFRANAPGGNR